MIDRKVADSLEPVSYTHLDVYKRQAQLHAESLAKAGAGCSGMVCDNAKLRKICLLYTSIPLSFSSAQLLGRSSAFVS